jgi:hypothetical protein
MNTIAWATTSDNSVGADEGITVMHLGTVLAEISAPVTAAQDPDLVLDRDEADRLLRDAGYQRTSEWTTSGGQYAAEVEPVA